MKLTRKILAEMVEQELKSVLSEKAIPGFDPKQFPNPLPPEYQEKFKTKGKDDTPQDDQLDQNLNDDVVTTKPASVPADKCHPSQSAVFLAKAYGMSMIPKLSNGDVDAVMSEEPVHILDGHHRWAATIITNGTSKPLQGVQVQLPIEQLIPVLRALGDSFVNNRKGNPGRKDLNVFTPQALDEATLTAMITENSFGSKFWNKEKWEAHLEAIGGMQVLLQRVQLIQELGAAAYGGKGVKNAPPRTQMPVIEPDKGEVRKASMLLNKGMLDVAPPYADYGQAGAKAKQRPGIAPVKEIKIRRKRK